MDIATFWQLCLSFEYHGQQLPEIRPFHYRPTISIHDNFFDLGGHSLLIMQVLSRLRERFALDLKVRDRFERPTIAEVAELLNSNGHRSSGNAEDAILPSPAIRFG